MIRRSIAPAFFGGWSAISYENENSSRFWTPARRVGGRAVFTLSSTDIFKHKYEIQYNNFDKLKDCNLQLYMQDVETLPPYVYLGLFGFVCDNWWLSFAPTDYSWSFTDPLEVTELLEKHDINITLKRNGHSYTVPIADRSWKPVSF